MAAPVSDALVFFGATGDLAAKQIFPALYELVRRGELNVPIVGVAKSGWTLDQLRAHARESIAAHDPLDEAVFAKLSGLLRYVDGLRITALETGFSFARALQTAALAAWRVRLENVAAGQAAFYQRAKLASTARRGVYSTQLEAVEVQRRGR
jgi:glucose-6-phosphate 1-dehydrogenase